jgi:hypothetical protein
MQTGPLNFSAGNFAQLIQSDTEPIRRSLPRSNGGSILGACVLLLRQIKKSLVPARTSVDGQIEQEEKFGWKL